MANLILALNHVAGGLDFRGYHAVNLLIHLLVVLTLWGFVWRSLRLPRLAVTWTLSVAEQIVLVVVLLWVVHFLQMVVVMVVVQRTELLCGLFYLLVFYLFVRGVVLPWSWRWWVGVALACFAGMGTKEVMVIAPVLLVLYDRTFVVGSFAGVWCEWCWVYGFLFAIWGLLVVILWQVGGICGTVAGFGLGVEWWQYVFK